MQPALWTPPPSPLPTRAWARSDDHVPSPLPAPRASRTLSPRGTRKWSNRKKGGSVVRASPIIQHLDGSPQLLTTLSHYWPILCKPVELVKDAAKPPSLTAPRLTAVQRDSVGFVPGRVEM
eukprot:6179964-Pleurochrysis_carterae.AAC.1